MTNCCLIDFEGMLRKWLRLGMQKQKVLNPSKPNGSNSQIIANVASSQQGAVQLTDRWSLGPYAERTTKTILADAKEWVLPEKQEDHAWSKTQKISMMPCNRWNMRSIILLLNAPLLGFVLGTNRLSGKSKRRFEIRNQGTGSKHRTAIFPTDFTQAGGST